ncbi:UNVERIFIED_CONTAM: hypothetical protein Slati_2201900 [Sesamum latifolium]|uniref:Uncharacterized protein n=1 Tax=Sesamum latifolium TaxID=2727402 RepID=A0AAW2WSG3_9LAMI
MCVDFRDINKVSAKDFYPLLRIDQLVDSTFSHEVLSLIVASSSYYQIMLNPNDLKRDIIEAPHEIEPNKVCFGVQSGCFLDYTVTEKGIEVNPNKIRAIQEIKTPTNLNELQRLAGCIAALNKFVIPLRRAQPPFLQGVKENQELHLGRDLPASLQKPEGVSG